MAPRKKKAVPEVSTTTAHWLEQARAIANVAHILGEVPDLFRDEPSGPRGIGWSDWGIKITFDRDGAALRILFDEPPESTTTLAVLGYAAKQQIAVVIFNSNGRTEITTTDGPTPDRSAN
jgi:hypothetical protein